MKEIVFVVSLIIFSFSHYSCDRAADARLHRSRANTPDARHTTNPKSNQTKRENTSKHKTKNNSHKEEHLNNGRTIIKMKKVNGVYTLPVEINGVEMSFIFDTGASIVSISETEANFLMKQGTLSHDDIIGTSKFTDANGDVSVGTIINLKTVKLGNRIIHNVKASVVHNSVAPLLLGQSVLNKFGKVTIDYEREVIILD